MTKFIPAVLPPVKVVNMMVILMLLTTSGTAQTATGYINLTGYVNENTCAIDSGSATQTITLPPVRLRDINATGAIDSAKTAVPITLRNCGASATSVVVNTSGKSHGQNNNMFDNIIESGTPGRASGMGIYFYQTNGTNPFFPDGRRAETIRLTPSVDNTLVFYTTYGVATTSITPGNISTVINMSFNYQ